MKYKEHFKIALKYIISLLSVCAVNEYLFGDLILDFKNGITSVFLFVFILLIGRDVSFKDKSKLSSENGFSDYQIHKASLWVSAGISIIFAMGNSIYRWDSLTYTLNSFGNYVYSLLCIAGMTYVLYLIIEKTLLFFRDMSVTPFTENAAIERWLGYNKASLLLWWGIIFLCWLPCWLAYYPGTFSYDTFRQIGVAENIYSLNNFDTVLHNIFVYICFSLSDTRQGGVVAYSLIQMVIMSFIFSYLLYILAKIKTKYFLRIIALISFALSPFNALFSFIITKDVLFCGAFLLCTITLLELSHNPDEFFKSGKNFRKAFCFLVLFCMLRKNAVYVLFITAAVVPFIFKEQRKKVIPLFVSAVLTGWLLTGPLTSLLGLSADAPREALSVPIQQVAYVVTNHWTELDGSQQETINKIFPINISQSYNPRLSDPIKDIMRPEDTGEFLNLWFVLFFKYPVEYFEAFLTLNLPYWYPDAENPDKYSQRRYIEDYIYGGFDVERYSRFPWLLEKYEKFAANDASWMSLPVLKSLTSVGLPIWVLIGVFILSLIKMKPGFSAAILPGAALWITNIFGPVSNVRYIYPLIAAYPLYLVLIFMISGKNKENAC